MRHGAKFAVGRGVRFAIAQGHPIYGSNNGFFETPMCDFLLVVNRDHSSELLSFF